MESLFSIFFVMENNIILMDDHLDEKRITLCNPNGVQGGSYMTKIKSNDNYGLYIQTPKLNTKQGIISTDKKSYFDIMIDKNNTDILSWIENLEECLQQKIYEKRNSWFETELDMEDIQNTMTPLLRPYKGGKYHLMRVAIPSMKNVMGHNKCAIYDENENVIGMNDVSVDKKIICILEIQGIKFSSKYFQVDINARQIMTFDDVSPFKTCIIRKPETNVKDTSKNTIGIETSEIENVVDVIVENANANDDSRENANDEHDNTIEIKNNIVDTAISRTDTINDAILSHNNNNDKSSIENETMIHSDKSITFDNAERNDTLELTDLDSSMKSSNTLEEISIDLENEDDGNIMQLKSKEFYYDIYRMALEKAKKAKRQALESFLEAKKIKETYMLDDIENESLDEDEDLENLEIDDEYEILT